MVQQMQMLGAQRAGGIQVPQQQQNMMPMMMGMQGNNPVFPYMMNPMGMMMMNMNGGMVMGNPYLQPGLNFQQTQQVQQPAFPTTAANAVAQAASMAVTNPVMNGQH